MSNLLHEIVSNELDKVLDLKKQEIYSMLEFPPNAEMGDVAFPCFTLAKTFKKAPQMIAGEIKEKLDQNLADEISEIKVLGGYLNFFLNHEKILDLFFEKHKQNNLWSKNKHSGKTALVEHTSINPNASPHIGRARNALIGDATVRLLRFLGYDTTVHYFVNDIGKQIALLAYCTKGIESIEFNELLSLYVQANEKLKISPEIEEEVFALLNKMEAGDEEVFKSFSRIVDICISGQMKIFNELGIFYDVYDYESRYITSGRTNQILEKLKQTEFLFEDAEGRLVLNLEKYNINSENPYLPLTRKDKTSLYPLRDVCYSIDKANFKTDKNIVVLGEDQKLYGRQINAVLDILGINGADIINYSFVLLPDGKMSTRAGKVVLLEDLMQETLECAKTKIAERRNVVDEKVAKQIAYGAIKYAILKSSNERNVIFDKDSALSFEGDTSVYLQYSHARIKSMLADEKIELCKDDFALLNTKYELDIIFKILNFETVVSNVEKDYNFSSLCTYLFDLCKLFSRWYNECPIKNAEGKLKNARLYLASIIAENISLGLEILGIEAPNKI